MFIVVHTTNSSKGDIAGLLCFNGEEDQAISEIVLK